MPDHVDNPVSTGTTSKPELVLPQAADRPNHKGALLAMLSVLVLSLTPILEFLCLPESSPFAFLQPYQSLVAVYASKIALTLAMICVVQIYVQNHPEVDLRAICVCLALAIAMTAFHCVKKENDATALAWQKSLYLDILNREPVAPHSLRPLPYGFARLLEWITGDWLFSCLAYRCFFTFWFLLSSHQFVRRWLSPRLSLVAIGIMYVLYHYSIQTYFGQLTDPMSHWLFVMALIFVVDNEWTLLAVALAIGIFAKETALLIVPAYFLCWRQNGWPTYRRTLILGAVCVLAYFAVRLPLGWRPIYSQINGAPDALFWTNIGWDAPAGRWLMTIRHHLFHVNLFFLVFVPFIAYQWRSLDRTLKILCLTVPTLVLATNVWFSLVHESRNYMPALPILLAASLQVFQPAFAGLDAKTEPASA
jgi:hypothetical protein